MISRKPIQDIVDNFDYNGTIGILNKKRRELNNFIENMDSEMAKQYIDEIVYLREQLMITENTKENTLKLYGWIKNYEDFMEYWHGMK